MKDQINVKGMKTTLGSVLFRDYEPGTEGFAVAKLRAAGAIFLGKSTLGELGGGDTHGSLFGSTRNVYDLARTAGGSSGGSGASVSANFCTVALGQEGFSSIRRPAAWNGIVGMRPTVGVVSRSGVYGGWPTTNGSVGPMARTVADAAKLLDVMAGYDPRDPVTAYAVGRTPASYSANLDPHALRGARIGILREPMGYKTEPELGRFQEGRRGLQQGGRRPSRQAGAEVIDPIEIPDLISLLATRAKDPAADDAMFELFFADGNAPFKTRKQAMASPLFSKVVPGSQQRWAPDPPEKHHAYLKARDRADDQPAQGHGRPPARRDRAQGRRAPADLDRARHQAAVRRSEGRSAHQHVPDVRAVHRGARPGSRAGRSTGGDYVPGAAV